VCESGRHGLKPRDIELVPFVLARRQVTDRLEQPPVVEAVDAFQGCVLDGIERPPRSARVNDLGLVETEDGWVLPRFCGHFHQGSY
jgi:hypothetical protein